MKKKHTERQEAEFCFHL